LNDSVINGIMLLCMTFSHLVMGHSVICLRWTNYLSRYTELGEIKSAFLWRMSSLWWRPPTVHKVWHDISFWLLFPNKRWFLQHVNIMSRDLSFIVYDNTFSRW